MRAHEQEGSDGSLVTQMEESKNDRMRGKGKKGEEVREAGKEAGRQGAKEGGKKRKRGGGRRPLEDYRPRCFVSTSASAQIPQLLGERNKTFLVERQNDGLSR